MRLGVMLPTFEISIRPLVEAAVAAEKAGLDGVFAYDHLWPMGHPGLPSLAMFPALAAVTTATTSISVGALVARVTLEPDEVVEAAFKTLSALAPKRIIAGLGTGDKKSEREGLAFGVAPTDAMHRRESLANIAARLQTSGLDVWIGGGGKATNAIARSLGCRLNLWAASVERVALLAGDLDVTWGGQLPDSPTAAVAKLTELARAGASWAVVSWPGEFTRLCELAATAGLRTAL